MSRKVGNGIWRDKLDKYQEASFYAEQARKPDGGVSARQIKESLSRSSKVKEVKKDEDNQL